MANAGIDYLIQKANAQYERSWTAVAKLCKLAGYTDGIQLSVRRLASYNTSSNIIREISPHIQMSYSLIAKKSCDYILQYRSVPDPESSYPILAKLSLCYLLLGDYANSYKALLNVIHKQLKLSFPLCFAAACVCQLVGDTTSACEFFNRAKNHPMCDKRLIPEITFRLALSQRETENFNQAIETFMSIQTPPEGLTHDDILFHIGFARQLQRNQPTEFKYLYTTIYGFPFFK